MEMSIVMPECGCRVPYLCPIIARLLTRERDNNPLAFAFKAGVVLKKHNICVLINIRVENLAKELVVVTILYNFHE